ncbi:Vacuolar protein sorting-associated protein Ist1 [Sesbania bispinosa]|nr:Vacuolar protein sorting-associated protein Ist1 [Sesbania bispinosa]
MFDILFGWSKASKCKKAIKRARCRLRLLKNKRQAIVRQLRKDLAELIQSGHEEAAINRVEQLLGDESLVAAYELLDQFCEFILTQFSYIRRNKDCPNDINEAVSSLIFASARCGDLPELCAIRKLFGKRYGEKFATTAVELSPGNLVSKQLKENLSGKSVPDDLKYRVVDEIARETCLQPQVLAIQYYPDWQKKKVKENKGYQLVESGAQINDTIGGSKVHPSEFEEIKRDVKCVKSSTSKPGDSCYLPESGFADTSAIVSTVQQYPPYILSCPLQKKVVKLDFPELLSSINSSLQNKGERLALESSADRISFPPYPEEMIDFVDDIEECQLTVPKDGASQDQMLFKFRSSGVSSREKTQFGCDESDIDQDESQSEKSSIRISRRRKRAGEKRSRRRSASQENLGIMDIGYIKYYQKPCRSPSAHKHGTHCHRKHQKPSLEGIPPSSYAQERLMLQSLSEKEKNLQSCKSEDGTRRKFFNFKMSGCSLDQPCYFCLYCDKDSSEALSMKPKRGIRATHVQQGVLLDECCHCRPFRDYELNQEMELVTIPQRPNRKSYSSVAEYHVFNYPHCQAGNGNNGTKAEISVSPNVSNPRTSDSLNRIETEAPYSRAMTMPQVRHINGKDKMLRTYSCPSQHPNHVHPKLPDYDDIAAKFTALKRGHQENKDCIGDQQGK